MSTVYDVAVVGSRGFLGSAVAAELDRRGAHVGRFTRDRPYVVDGQLAAVAPVVVWAAGRITPADVSGARAGLAELKAFAEAAHRSADLPSVVLLSSGGATYGPPASAPFAESDRSEPANEYGRVKFAEETELVRSGLDPAILRIANPYGPGQVTRGGAQGVVGAWMRAVLAGQPVTMFGDGSVVRDYIYIDDVAQAVAAAVECEPGGTINIGSGEGTSLSDLLAQVSLTVAPRQIEVRHEPARGIDPPANWLNVARARTELDWAATTSLQDGLARTWAAVSA